MPGMFQRDLQDLESIGRVSSLASFRMEVSELRNSRGSSRTFLHDTLNLRISGRLLLDEGESVWRLADELSSSNEQQPSREAE